jgi:hypothetical protein
MNPIAGKGMTRFSPCTIGSICSQIGQGGIDTQCLVSPAEVNQSQGEVNLPDSECGNGVVEGEEPWNPDILKRFPTNIPQRVRGVMTLKTTAAICKPVSGGMKEDVPWAKRAMTARITACPMIFHHG